MCEPSAEVRRAWTKANRASAYYRPHDWLADRLAMIETGIGRLNDYPEVYLQVVFRFFRTVLTDEEDTLAYLTDFLRDFAFLPVRYDNQAAYQANHEDRRNLSWLWDLYWENPLYEDFIQLTPNTHPVPIQFTYYQMIQPWLEHPITTNFSQKKAYAQFGDMFQLLHQCFQQYINVKRQRERDGQAANPLGDELIYKTRLSLVVALLGQFNTQMEVVEGIKINLMTRLNPLLDYSLQLLNSSPQNALYLHLRNALSALSQSARFVALSQNANGPPTYLLYLQRIQLYQVQWPWDTNIVGNSPEAAQIFTSPVYHDSLLHGSSLLLQSLNILPSITEPWTNAMLVELLVDHLVNLRGQVQRIARGRDGAIVQVASPFDVRNQLIWYGAVANGWWMYLLSTLEPQSRMALGVPDEFTLDD